MTSFRKALKSQIAASRHAFRHVGFSSKDKSLSDYGALMIEKSTRIMASTRTVAGGWGARRGRM